MGFFLQQYYPLRNPHIYDFPLCTVPIVFHFAIIPSRWQFVTTRIYWYHLTLNWLSFNHPSIYQFSYIMMQNQLSQRDSKSKKNCGCYWNMVATVTISATNRYCTLEKTALHVYNHLVVHLFLKSIFFKKKCVKIKSRKTESDRALEFLDLEFLIG